MDAEDILYLCILLFSIPFGHVVKLSGSPAAKKFLCTVAGIGLSVVLVGADIFHSFLTVLGTYLIIVLLGPRKSQWPNFIFVFGYLLFFRTCSRWGLSEPAKHCNAIQLLVTLRMITIAFEGFDPEVMGEKDVDKIQRPSLYDITAYAYCYCGLLTGPYYRYKTYRDFLHQRHPEEISTFVPAMRKLKPVPLLSVVYLLCNHYFPKSHVGSDDYVQHPWGVLYQLAYLVPMFYGFRWRFYIGWLLAESACMMMGLGAYPFETDPKPGIGPTKPVPVTNGDLKETGSLKEQENSVDTHSFETVHNIDLLGVEFACSMRSTMKNWNMTVQWWMAVFVYKKLPFASKDIRLAVTLLVSAFWHGVYPGYYLTFLSVPFMVMAETRMEKAIKPHLSPQQCKIYDWVAHFFLYRGMEYLGCGFMLLHMAPTIAAWKSLRFIGHVVIACFLVIPVLIPKKRVDKNELKKAS